MTNEPGAAGIPFHKDPGEIVKFEVNVVDGKPSTQPDRVRLVGEGYLLAWELGESARDWEFAERGISFASDPQGQFINPYRFSSGRKFVIFDRNTKAGIGPHKYTVSLVHRVSKQPIHEDPIIENEADG